MTNTNQGKLHPEMLKMFNSPFYRKKIKRAVTALKVLHNIHSKLPGKSSSLSPDTSTAHYFSQPTEFTMERRNGSGAPKQQ
jgi:hypothetical protein